MNPTTRPHRLAVFAAASLAILAVLVASPPAATAATPPVAVAPSATDGWVRVAHLSPDTKAVNVTVSNLAGGKKLFELDHVAYGTVSPYEHFPAGTYTISMTPWSSKPASKVKPMLSASVKIVKGKSVTVAAFGTNRHLSTKVFHDILTAPKPGKSRIRIIQASTITKSVTVTTSTGALIASDAISGTSTSYATVAAGTWTLKVHGKAMTDIAHLSLTPGSVETLFVLDNASGGLTVKPVLDSASVGTDPVGGINTGGGWAATHDPSAVAAPTAG